MRITLLITFVISAVGCATSMTTMTDAKAYEPGEIQATMGLATSLNTNVVGGVVDAAVSAVDRFGTDSNTEISEEEYREWLDGVLLFAMFRPAVNPELSVRAGVTDSVLSGIDIGLKTNFNLVKGDVKLQFWESEDQRMALSLMAGYAYHLGVAPGLVELITLTEFSRGDIDIQPLWGVNVGDVFKFTGGPRLLLSRVSTEHKIPEQIEERLPDEILELSPNNLFRNEWIVNVGANAVMMLGYKYAFVALDLGVFYSRFRPEVIGEVRDYDGVTISVAGGLSIHASF